MLTFEPKFQIVDLQQVVPGTPVVFDNEIAFAGINQSAPPNQQLIILAAFDPQQRKFVYRYFASAQPHVLVLELNAIIRPNLKSLSQNVAVAASTNLYLAEEPCVVVNIPSTNDNRIMGISSGSLMPIQSQQMHAFTSWEIGYELRGEFVSLLKI